MKQFSVDLEEVLSILRGEDELILLVDQDTIEISTTYATKIADLLTRQEKDAKLGRAAVKDYRRYIKNDCMGKFQKDWDGCTKNCCTFWYMCESERSKNEK
jgi:hypothetical protein